MEENLKLKVNQVKEDQKFMLKFVSGIVAVFLLVMLVKWVIPSKETPLSREQKMRMAIEEKSQGNIKKEIGSPVGKAGEPAYLICRQNQLFLVRFEGSPESLTVITDEVIPDATCQ